MRHRDLSDTRPTARFPVLRLVVALAAFILLLSLTAPPPAAAANKLLPLVTVQLKNGERYTLRDADFLVQGGGERPHGSSPPGPPIGPIPGNTPGGDPGESGPGWPTGRDPRQPTQNLDGTRRRPEAGIGLSKSDLYRLRRVDIVRVEKGVTYADFTYKDGNTRINAPMIWSALSGWERPGREGKFYFFEAQEILFLEFPSY